MFEEAYINDKGIVIIDGTRLRFPNFEGRAGEFNAKGNRNTCVDLPKNLAEELREQGWNIKQYVPTDSDSDPIYYTQVNVQYWTREGKPVKFPPKIVLIVNGKETQLDEESVKLIDNAEIANVKIAIRPREWEPGKVKGYLKTLYVEIIEDEFARYYSED